MWAVSELGEHPGAEDGPQAGLAEVDLSVWVLAKTLTSITSSSLMSSTRVVRSRIWDATMVA